jgi:hypothetical protein
MGELERGTETERDERVHSTGQEGRREVERAEGQG